MNRNIEIITLLISCTVIWSLCGLIVYDLYYNVLTGDPKKGPVTSDSKKGTQ